MTDALAMTAKEVAAALGVSPAVIHRQIRETGALVVGEVTIPALKIGAATRIPRVPFLRAVQADAPVVEANGMRCPRCKAHLTLAASGSE